MTAVTIARRTRNVTIFQGDDLALIQELSEAANRAAADGGDRRLGDDAVSEAATAYDAAVADAITRAVVVTVRALSRKTYRSLIASCPPRDDNDGDAALGYDQDTFADMLLSHAEGDERTLWAPFADKHEVGAFLDDISEGHTDELFNAAVMVNEGGNPDPKVSLTSLVERLSGTTSTSPSRLA